MKRFLALLTLAFSLQPSAFATNVQFNFYNLTNYPGSRITVKLTPDGTPGGMLLGPLQWPTDTNGNLTITNLIPNGYTVDAYGPYLITEEHITVTNCNCTINFTNILSTTNLPSSATTSYSITASDARYVQLANGLIPPGAVYTNDSNLGLVDYQVPTVSGQTYLGVISTNGNEIDDNQFNVLADFPGGSFIATVNGTYCFPAAQIAGQPVTEQVYPANSQNTSVSNFLSTGVAAFNKVFGGTFADGTFEGNFSGNVTGSVVTATSGNVTPAIPEYNLPLNTNLSGNILRAQTAVDYAFFPQHDILSRCMPVPQLWFSTYLISNPSATYLTNIFNMLVANGMAAAGITNVEIDNFWQNTNILRTPSGGPISYNTNLFPAGISNVIAYGHSLGINTIWYLFYSQRGCGDTYDGEHEGSPPGYAFEDIQWLALQGADGVNMDTCGVPLNEEAQRQMYLETVNAVETIMQVSFINFPYHGKAFAVREGNTLAGQQQFPWVPWECNIAFDGAEIGDSTKLNSAVINWYNVSSNSWCIMPGHYLNIDNIVDSYNTNIVCAQMSMMAILPQSDLFTGTNAANLVYVTNREVLNVCQDPGVIPGKIIVNNSTGQIWYRPLGSVNGPVKAAVFVNTNSTSQTIGIPFTSLGFPTNTVCDVRDCWGHNDLGVFVGGFTNTIAATNCPLYTFTAQPTGATLYLTSSGGITLATNSTAPGNTSTIRAWVTVTNSTGGVFKMPLYQ